MSIIRQALEMNEAIYEMFFSVSDGAISSQELAESTNKAMELNKNALIELSRLENMQKAVVEDWGNIDFNARSEPTQIKILNKNAHTISSDDYLARHDEIYGTDLVAQKRNLAEKFESAREIMDGAIEFTKQKFKELGIQALPCGASIRFATAYSLAQPNQEPADDEDYQKLIHTQSDLEHSRAFAKDLSCQIDKLKRELSETKLLLARFKKQELVNIKYLNAVKEVVRISDRDHIAWDTVKEFIFCAEQNVGGAIIDELTESIIIICDFEDAIAHYAKTKDEAWRNGDGAQIMAVYQASTERGKKMVAEMIKTPKDQKSAE